MQLSNEKHLRCLGYIGDYTRYPEGPEVGIITSHYKDSYEAASILESKRSSFVAQLMEEMQPLVDPESAKMVVHQQ